MMELSVDRLPHEPPMRWIYAASRITEEEVLAEAILPGESGDGKTTSILLGVEVLAQAAGLLLANPIEPSEAVAEGRLLQVKSARWKEDDLPLAIPLEARVKRLESSAMGLHQFAGSLSVLSGEILLQADFSLLVPPPAV